MLSNQPIREAIKAETTLYNVKTRSKSISITLNLEKIKGNQEKNYLVKELNEGNLEMEWRKHKKEDRDKWCVQNKNGV